MGEDLSERKDQHLDIVLNKAVAGVPPALAFGRFSLQYDALPDVDLEAVDLSTTVLGKRLAAPLVIGAMTGGTERAARINRVLARAAARVGVGMALGSQRAMLVRPQVTASFQVRDAAPDLPLLFGNIGAVQLNYGVGAAEINQLAAAVGADAMNLHLNPLQEAIQPGGDTRFSGLAKRMAEVLPLVDVPCVVKEVGAGISSKTARKLAKLPIAGVESAGTGGTSWAAVEAHRADGDLARQQAGHALAGFGVPTWASIGICRKAFPQRLVVGSGGLRTGMDLAVALALGADVVALAKPLLEAATEGVEATVRVLEALIFELRVIAFCTGSATVGELSFVRVLDATTAGLDRGS